MGERGRGDPVSATRDDQPLIISVAVTGGDHGREKTPHIPITPREIAESAHEAHLAGAAIAHIHVRDDEGGPAQALDRYRFVIDYLAERSDVVVNLTTNPGEGITPQEQLLSLELRPELASFDAGTLNFGESVLSAPLPFLRELAARMLETGTRPELEIFDSGMIGTCLRLREEGLLEDPLYFQFVLGVPGGAPATAESLLHMLRMIPPDSPWSVTGIGRHGVAMAMLGILLGGHVRVGLEDQIYYSRGRLAASNAELVARVVRLAEEFGRPIATPGQAREILSLRRERIGSPAR